MSTTSSRDVTHLLLAWSEGDSQALPQLMPLVYDHLHRVARDYMRREREGHTLQPTALVHEAYLRLAGSETISCRERTHFFSLAARAMRHILVEHARARQRLRRGGAHPHVPLTGENVIDPSSGSGDTGLLALDAALERLSLNYPRQSQVVVLRFFGGMEMPEIAEVLQVADRTIKRDWRFARMWLQRELDLAGNCHDF